MYLVLQDVPLPLSQFENMKGALLIQNKCPVKRAQQSVKPQTTSPAAAAAAAARPSAGARAGRQEGALT